MKQSIVKNKVNNSGFSLLEVLVGVIIIAIVSVPLLRAFGTSAQTNAKAKLQSEASTAAENIMEVLRNFTADDLEAKIAEYSTGSGANTVTTDSGNVVKLIVNDASDWDTDLPDGCSAEITLDPGGYPNANSLNLSQFEAVTVRDCAIYTMSDDYDYNVYNQFVDKNKALIDAHVAGKYEKTYDQFKKDLQRIVNIYILNNGSVDDGTGNMVDLIKVRLEVKYKLDSYSNYLMTGDQEYIATDAFLFDNTTSKIPLENVYLFFNPRYTAGASSPGGDKDIINIYNEGNIKTNVYLTAMNSTGSVFSDAPDQAYWNGKGLRINVFEGEDTGSTTPGFICLRTNMLKTSAITGLRTPYSTTDTAGDYGLMAQLNYKASPTSSIVYDQNAVLSVSRTDPGYINQYISNYPASFKVSLSDIDGKRMLTDDSLIRIYKVTAVIKDADGNDLVQYDGTKLKRY